MSARGKASKRKQTVAEKFPSEEAVPADAFKTLVSCLTKKKKSSFRKRRSRKASDASSSEYESEESSTEKRPDVDVASSSGEENTDNDDPITELKPSAKEDEEFSDENEFIHSDDDDESTIDAGSVTTFTPTRSSDPYIAHFGLDLSESSLEKLEFSKYTAESCKFLSPGLYMQSPLSRFRVSSGTAFRLSDAVNLELFPDLRKMKVKASLVNRLAEVNAKHLEKLTGAPLLGMTPTQFEFFLVLNNYIDCYCPKWTLENADELRIVYCLHVLNHLLKSRKQIALNNTAIKKHKKTDREFRDRGLTRPKVLILVPFRESASKIVQTLWSLLTDSEHLVVSNKKRFVAEYGLDVADQKKARNFRATPTDFETLFAGNVDDNFRLGVSISKRTVKLFTGFYNSDLIIASPLGLRSITPRENPLATDKSKASTEESVFDFLSSIEVLIMDQGDVCLMQNWDHVLSLMNSVNAMPKQPHDVDFSRVRMWSLNGLARYYRQTVVLSNIVLPEFNAFMTKYSTNRNGRIIVSKVIDSGSVNDVIHQAPQLFHRVEPCDGLLDAADKRFTYFTTKILPQIVDSDIRQTLVFVPSYFDYVRLRNYCKREQFNGLYISEYTKDNQVSRVRSLFFHAKVVFMLYTERLHFFKRYRIRGVRNIVFYALPSYPHFYSEIANWMAESPTGETCQIVSLYTRYDIFHLAGIVGSSMAGRMLSPSAADRGVHLFVAGQQQQQLAEKMKEKNN